MEPDAAIFFFNDTATTQVQLTWSAEAVDFALEQADDLDSSGRWTAVPETPANADGVFSVTLQPSAHTRFFRLRGTAPVVTTITQTSPAAGEPGVAVTRETIFRFSAPLAAETLLTGRELFAEFGGRRWLARTELSSDRRTATLFYLENLPSSAQVRVTLDGASLYGADGLLLDADGDGLPGGRQVLEFDTAGIGGLPGTAVVGHVFASAKNPDGSNQPLVNVTVTVNGAEESLRATTDETGYFKLQPAPAGRFFVHIDGRTALGSQWPDGAYYPFVGKAWTAVAGKTDNLAGGSGEIFLPLIQSDALQSVSSTTETRITFSPSVIAANPVLAGVEIMVPPNALFADNGARGGKVGIAPVPPDRLPEPLPSGLNLPMVITIQTDGGMNFDVPVPVKFPNLPDPVTGTKPPPGGKTVLWSFNHDSGRWEPQGTMTISADGKFAVTDPGVGVRQPGWHGTNPGSGGGGPDPTPRDPPPPGPCSGAFDCDGDGCLESMIECPKDDCDKYLKEIQRLEEYCSISDAIRDKRDAFLCNLPLIDCPDPAWKEKWDQCRQAIADAQFNYTQCLLAQGAFSAVRKSSRRPAGPSEDDPRFAQQSVLTAAAAVPVNLLLGNPEWTQVEPRELDVWVALLAALAEAAEAASPAGAQINSAESATILALTLPTNLTPALVQTAIARLNAYRNNTLAGAERTQIDNASAAYSTLWAGYQAEGWRTTSDGYYQVADEQSAAAAEFSAETFARNRRLYFRLADLTTGFEIRGRLNTIGRFENVILAPDTYYTVEYLDPVTGAIGNALFRSAFAGQNSSIPAAPMTVPTGLTDTDDDGLPDALEGIPGTRPDQADTDNDGVNDGAELAAGTDPTNGASLSPGLVNVAATSHAVIEVAVGDDFAVTGVGVVGFDQPFVTVFDVHDPLNPVKVAELPSGGQPVEAVAADGGRAAFTDFSGRLHLIELDAPGGPRVTTSVLMPQRGLVALGGGRVFTAPQSAAFKLELRDGLTGEVIAQVPAANSTVSELKVHDGYLYAVEGDVLGIWEIQPASLVARGTLQLTNEFPPSLERGLKLFVEDGRAYVGTSKGYRVVDVSNPDAPVLVGTSTKAQLPVHAIAHNGSGRLVATTSQNGFSGLGISLYDATNPTITTNRLANWLTAGFARGLVLHRGFALVADTTAGLTTLNYLAADRGTNPPTISLRARVTVPPDRQEGAREFGVVAVTTDDVQVRDVEFYVDDVFQRLDGGHPFTATLWAPAAVLGKTTFTVRAKATDTAGNSTWSSPLVLKLEPDMTPPALVSVTPEDETVWLPGELPAATATFNEKMSAAALSAAFRVFALGADGTEGTADDVLMPASLAYPSGDGETARLTFNSALPEGRYFARVTTAATDVFNNAITNGAVW
ncbi:MAG TPA: hypothetical protein DCE44_14790, partial [Verrucomicrobiales bacterium]|nr:hypothetical protein [Verrucomicrobiales bacterium]